VHFKLNAIITGEGKKDNKKKMARGGGGGGVESMWECEKRKRRKIEYKDYLQKHNFDS